MSWAQIDDHFDDHPKYIGYGAAEMGVLACALTFSNRHLTDGVIPKAWVLTRFGKDGARAMKSFLEDGVWTEKDAKHCAIVGFLEHNPSREEVLARRAKLSEQKAEAGRAGGIKSGEARRSRLEADSKQTRSSCSDSASSKTKQNEALSSPILSSPILEEKRSPLPPVDDSNPEWGIDPERESRVQPVAEEPPEPLAMPGITPRQLEYQRAYESGVAAGKGAPYAMPEPQRAELHRAILTFAKSRDGKAYRGDVTLRWIEHTAKEFAASVRGREATYYSAFGPRGFVRWLNEAELVAEEASDG